jgi:hypothetical protein
VVERAQNEPNDLKNSRKDAGGFSAQTELGEEVWPIWCWPGGLIMV